METSTVLRIDLLATKLFCPEPPANGVERPRLAQRLSDGLALQRPLTLVSAPAGFGKTCCVSEWLHGLDGWLVAWLSLDPADDDPVRFLAYLIGALQKVRPGVGQEITDMLHTGQLPPAEVVSTALINNILESDDQAAGAPEGRFLLVLDDIHVIQEPFILQVLQNLLDNLPPAMHLVLITREDPPLPLARLRAGNRLTEIRANDLRFSDNETGRFFNKRLGLSLAPADLTRLEEKTEGWIAGLQLAALALEGTSALQGTLAAGDRVDPSHFIASLSGSHRFILDYLTEQVLDHQPPEIRHFLLQTSILERLNGDLCDAVTGRADGQATLARLFKANLFLVALDDAGQWYRYHHLFGDLLRSRHGGLPKEEATKLHLRASRWYAQAGMAGQAIDHALAAGEYTMAMELLDTYGMDMIRQGFAKTVNGWLQAIPVAWRGQSTRTDLAFAWMHLLRGAYAEAEPYLEQAGAALAEVGQGEETSPEAPSSAAPPSEAPPLTVPSLKSQWLTMRSLVQQMKGKLVESEALSREALAIAPEQDSDARGLAYFALGSALRLNEALTPAVDAYKQAIQLAQEADNPVTEMLSRVGLAGMAFERGHLRLAAESAEPVIARLEGSGTSPPMSSVLYGVLGEVHFQWRQLEEARRYSQRALELSTLGGYNSGQIMCRIYLSRLAQIEGDLEDARRELRQANDLVSGQLPDYVRQELVAQQVRLHLARKRPDAARLALQGEYLAGAGGLAGADGNSFISPELPSSMKISHAAGLLYNSTLRLLLYLARAGNEAANLRRGIEQADQILTGALEGRFLLVALEALLLRAQMRAMLAGSQEDEVGELAATDYLHALELAEPEGIIAVFIEQGPPVAEALAKLLELNRLSDVQAAYTRRIITLTQDQSWARHAAPAAREALVEPLTGRELEVLGLIAEGLKYKEIAGRLFISLNTVRFHVKAIYSKLGVNTRAQAIDKARQLRIL